MFKLRLFYTFWFAFANFPFALGFSKAFLRLPGKNLFGLCFCLRFLAFSNHCRTFCLRNIFFTLVWFLFNSINLRDGLSSICIAIFFEYSILFSVRFLNGGMLTGLGICKGGIEIILFRKDSISEVMVGSSLRTVQGLAKLKFGKFCGVLSSIVTSGLLLMKKGLFGRFGMGVCICTVKKGGGIG